MLKLLLLGASGQLGKELSRTLPSVGEIKASDRSDTDLTNWQSILAVLDAFKPDVIVNAAAYTNVDKAESERKLAFDINAEAVGFLANEAKKRDIWLFHYSTDYVFDGRKVEAYVETDATNPLSVYGKSKLAGEKAIAAIGCKYLVFRTSWVMGRDGSNFAKVVLRLATERESLSVINDQFGVPTSPALISKVTLDATDAIKKGDSWPMGIYHLVPKGKTTWFGIAEALLKHASDANIELLTKASQLKAITAAEYPTTASRPTNSHLNTGKLSLQLSFDLPNWRDDFAATAEAIIRK